LFGDFGNDDAAPDGPYFVCRTWFFPNRSSTALATKQKINSLRYLSNFVPQNVLVITGPLDDVCPVVLTASDADDFCLSTS
jgi:hypothetical protein